ncbi:unnamed protein product, partial [Ectocarpus sp. 13 AM-2016]
ICLDELAKDQRTSKTRAQERRTRDWLYRWCCTRFWRGCFEKAQARPGPVQEDASDNRRGRTRRGEGDGEGDWRSLPAGQGQDRGQRQERRCSSLHGFTQQPSFEVYLVRYLIKNDAEFAP